jgi:hypothetical protein
MSRISRGRRLLFERLRTTAVGQERERSLQTRPAEVGREGRVVGFGPVVDPAKVNNV